MKRRNSGRIVFHYSTALLLVFLSACSSQALQVRDGTATLAVLTFAQDLAVQIGHK